MGIPYFLDYTLQHRLAMEALDIIKCPIFVSTFSENRSTPLLGTWMVLLKSVKLIDTYKFKK